MRGLKSTTTSILHPVMDSLILFNVGTNRRYTPSVIGNSQHVVSLRGLWGLRVHSPAHRKPTTRPVTWPGLGWIHGSDICSNDFSPSYGRGWTVSSFPRPFQARWNYSPLSIVTDNPGRRSPSDNVPPDLPRGDDGSHCEISDHLVHWLFEVLLSRGRASLSGWCKYLEKRIERWEKTYEFRASLSLSLSLVV